MMSALLFIHFIAIGVWAGCVATEVVCEFSQKHENFRRSYIALLHWNIDKYVEIPAILIALVTGALMLDSAVFTSALTLKVGAGMAAVVLNSFASYTVYQRYSAYKADDEEKYLRYHQLHERVGVACVLAIITAIIAGGYHLVAG